MIVVDTGSMGCKNAAFTGVAASLTDMVSNRDHNDCPW